MITNTKNVPAKNIPTNLKTQKQLAKSVEEIQQEQKFTKNCLLEMLNKLEKGLSSQKNIEFEHVPSLFFALTNIFPEHRIDLIKGSKWEQDAIIFRLASKNNQFPPVSIKIHENKYPIASHFYNNLNVLKTLSDANTLPKIYKSFIVHDEGSRTFNNQAKQFRVSCYKYSNGVSLPTLLRTAKKEEIKQYQKLVYETAKAMIDKGVNPLIKDLHDILITFKQGYASKAIITDVNCLIPCEKADQYSKANIMDIIDFVIKKLVTKDYIPYTIQRPTLADIRNK